MSGKVARGYSYASYDMARLWLWALMIFSILAGSCWRRHTLREVFASDLRYYIVSLLATMNLTWIGCPRKTLLGKPRVGLCPSRQQPGLHCAEQAYDYHSGYLRR